MATASDIPSPGSIPPMTDPGAPPPPPPAPPPGDDDDPAPAPPPVQLPGAPHAPQRLAG